MIINIKGGIGNQLFQYALALKIQYLSNSRLKFDISSYIGYIFPYKYRLSNFIIQNEIASNEEIARIKSNFIDNSSILKKSFFRKYGILSKGLRFLFRQYDLLTYYKKNVVEEKRDIFDKRIFNVKDNTYLDGYWAKYKYFEDIRDILLKEITLKPEYETEEYKAKQNEILKRNESVSIHIRRGYAKREIDLKIFGVMDTKYYSDAIFLIKTKVSNPYFYIFSDDMNWVKENLNLEDNHEFINLGPEGDYLELMLMSQCKYNIIANSTFSWWGAWLNQNPNKIVIAPKRWYNKEQYQKIYEKGHLVPDTWIKI